MSGPRPRGPARERVRAVARRRRAVLALALWALVGALPTFAAGQAVARAVDDGFLAGRTAVGLAWLGVLAATVPVGAVGSRRTYLGAARLVEPLRDDLVRLVVDGALRRATATAAAGPGVASAHGGAVARLSQHVEAVRDTVAGLLLLVLGFVAGIVAALLGLLTLAPAVLPLVAVPLVVSFVAFAASLPGLARHQRRLLVADEALAELADDVARSLRDVVACGGEDWVEAALARRIDAQAAAARAMARVAAVRTVIVAVGARLPLVLVLFAAGWLLDNGLSAGALLGTLTYLVQGLGPAVSSIVGGIGTPLAQLSVTLARIDEETAAAAPADAGTGTGGPSPSAAAAALRGPEDGLTPHEPSVHLRGVTFRYRRAAEPVVRDLDLAVPAGGHLAIVGPSGAGKSTLAALMVGLLTPDEGRALIGGLDAAEVAARHRVLIPQQAYVFRGRLDQNVRYLAPDAGRDDLAAAFAALGMDDLVARCGGPAAVVEPSRLSAGERQLVALARAWLAPARLVVLDEATCHLDPATEAVVESAFARRPGTTLVVVAHRLSSAQRAEQVLLLDGAHVAQGTHDELVRRSDVYRDLVGHWLEPALA
ncbi:MAG TPA: ABC transporter ATP-binding protein [Acidimicrobiales bacterium]